MVALVKLSVLLPFLALPPTEVAAFSPARFGTRASHQSSSSVAAGRLRSTTEETASAETKNENVAQTENTSREKVMTFSYDMSLEPKYEKPTYPGTGNGLSGDAGEYDVVVIGSGMGGLACGALSAKYGDKAIVLESHIKCGGSAHTFSRMHKGGKYSFEVGPSIFEGLDRPSLNPLRMIFDMLGEEMPVETYTGLGYWTPTGYWRFPIGSKQKFEDLLMEQAEDGPKAVEVGSLVPGIVFFFFARSSSALNRGDYGIFQLTNFFFSFANKIGMERAEAAPQDARRVDDGRVASELASGCRIPCNDRGEFAFRRDAPRRLPRSAVDVRLPSQDCRPNRDGPVPAELQ